MTGRMFPPTQAPRYRIAHRSAYRYEQAVHSSFNEARLLPATSSSQFVLDSVLRTDHATWQHSYLDYWGTRVNVIEVHEQHAEMVVETVSVVELYPANRPTIDRDLAWADLRTPEVTSAQYEFLTQLPSTEPPGDLAEMAQDVAAGAASPHEAARGICQIVNEQMEYVPGSTGVNTAAEEAWEARSGVCQDYAHLAVGALRHVGIPARYVSGYLHPEKQPTLNEPVAGESHAWVEWWLGAWFGHDPTNATDVGDRHVVIGTGRHYGDVPPIKGILAGEPLRTDLDVEVRVTRLA